MRAETISQVQAGRFSLAAGYVLYGKIGQVERDAGDGDREAARYHVGRIRENLRTYRDDGSATATAYQALIARLDVLDRALS